MIFLDIFQRCSRIQDPKQRPKNDLAWIRSYLNLIIIAPLILTWKLRASLKEKKEKHIWKTMWILIYFLVIIVLYRKKSYVKALKFKEEYPSKLRKAGNELKNKIVSSAPSQFKAVASDLDWHAETRRYMHERAWVIFRTRRHAGRGQTPPSSVSPAFYSDSCKPGRHKTNANRNVQSNPFLSHVGKQTISLFKEENDHYGKNTKWSKQSVKCMSVNIKLIRRINVLVRVIVTLLTYM